MSLDAGPFLSPGQEKLVDEMYNLPYCFLGGSRRMKQKYPADIYVTEKTDWDFYIKDSKQIRKTLFAKGFRIKLVPEEYRDALCKAVFSHDILNIQVVLRKNVDAYKEIFESLSSEIYATRLWKSSKFKIDPNLDDFEQSKLIKDYVNGLYSLHKKLFSKKKKRKLELK